MAKMNRREALKTMGLASLATGLTITGCKPGQTGVEQKQHDFYKQISEEDIKQWENQFFTDHEYETVRVLGNLIIPADDRSGNAEDAGVPAFIDFMMFDHPWNQTPMRGGLSWLDVYCQREYGNTFIKCSESQQKELLDQIAYPESVSPEMQAGATFFSMFRDYTASGFWSSKIGIEDLDYRGNVPHHWTGCPQEACDHIGVSYED